jgi:uncharacterized membrane protein YgcG
MIRRVFHIVMFALCVPLSPLAESVNNMPQPTSYVTDLVGVLSKQSNAQIDRYCSNVEKQTHAQIAVAIINTTEGEPIDKFARDLANRWGVGPKDTNKGVLLLFAIKDRKWRISVGYGLEDVITDAKAADIGAAMLPKLHAGDYDGAVSLGVQRIAEIIAADAKVKLQSKVYPQLPLTPAVGVLCLECSREGATGIEALTDRFDRGYDEGRMSSFPRPEMGKLISWGSGQSGFFNLTDGRLWRM